MKIFQRLILATVAAALLVAGLPQRSDAAVFFGLSVQIGPPALPVYYQPPAPYPNMLWQPGYWAWGPYGYFWVPGTWVAAPQPGYLWTPGYWAYDDAYYTWHPGFWATHIGYYGGINYGFGYFGTGFVGGGWFGNAFRYNTAVTNVNTTVIHNVYVDRTVVNNYYNTNVSRVSYNGGNGVRLSPTAEQLAIARGPHFAMTQEQSTHLQLAQSNRSYLASVNNGRPTDPVVARPLTSHNLPANFAQVREADRTAGTQAANVHTNGVPGYHPESLAPSHSTMTERAPAAPAYHAPAAPAYHAPAAPAYHAPAAPAYHAPAAPAYHAPVTTHQQPAPAYHSYHAPPAPVHAAPVMHHTTTAPAHPTHVSEPHSVPHTPHPRP